MLTERIDFPGPHGKLSAKLDAPTGTPRAYGIFAHCFTCSKDVLAATHIARRLAGLGVAVLRFDFAGLGSSHGDFADTNFSSNVEDLVTAADYLRATFAAPQLLIGHSLGGAAVLAAAHRVPEAKAVVTIAAPSDPHYVVHSLLSEHLDTIAEQGEARLIDVAENMAVTQATASKIVARLKREGLVESKPYRSLFLTEAGARMAEESRRRHRIVYDFLRALGLDQSTAEADSEGIEHHVSNATLDALQRLTTRFSSGAIEN